MGETLNWSLQTRGLRFRYSAASPELAFPDLDLAAGQHALVRGPSGCGKSTWLALVAGLRSASAGDATLAGKSWQALSAAQRDAWRGEVLGFLPQRLHLSEGLSALDNVCLAFWAVASPLPLAQVRAAALRALAELGVADVAQQRPGQLSGGQAQRVALARATVLSPRVILADEPTASLDDAACAAALNLLLARAEALDASLVIATHDGRVAVRMPSAHALTLSLPQALGASKPVAELV
jgi:putative ABC transport system ATP-binding protein